MRCAEMAEPIRELSGVWTQVGLSNHLLGGPTTPHREGASWGTSHSPLWNMGNMLHQP